MNKDRKSARARALRAAQVMSIAAGLSMGAGACALRHTRGEPIDSGSELADSGPDRDTGPRMADAGHDAGFDAGVDAGDCELTWNDALGCQTAPSAECCVTQFGSWDENGCCYTAVEGPLMPPSAPV